MRFLVMLTAGTLALGGLGTAVAAAFGVRHVAGPLFGGMIGPLLAVAITGVLVVRAHRQHPETVHAVMMAAFFAKALFFAAYSVAMVKVFDLDVRAFGLSFAVFFIALYGIEAAFFARLFRSAARGAR